MSLKIGSTLTYQSLEGYIEHPAELQMVKTLLRAYPGVRSTECLKAFDDRMLGNTDSLVVVGIGIGSYISVHNRYELAAGRVEAIDGRKT